MAPMPIIIPAGLSFEAPDSSDLQNGLLPFPIYMEVDTNTVDGGDMFCILASKHGSD